MDADKIMDICVRRGFLWRSCEIYGGVGGFYDLGPLGVALERGIKDLWRELFVVQEGGYEIDTPTIMPEVVFVASGHVAKFHDPLSDCASCKKSFRADHIIEEAVGRNVEGLPTEELDALIADKGIVCPECGGTLGPIRYFNLMFRTSIGSTSTGGATAYARPETAQGMFVAFNRIMRTMRPRLPFSIIQIGKAYRNEISPRQGLLRVREFTQMEAEVFLDGRNIDTHPRFDSLRDETLRLFPREEQLKQDGVIVEMPAGEAVDKGIIDNPYLGYYLTLSKFYLLALGIPWEAVRFRQQLPDEKAHYSRDTWDVEIETSYGWVEVAGHAYRTDYDLSCHTRVSGKDLAVFLPFDEPKVEIVRKAVPDKGALGKRFKSAAKEALEFITERNADLVKAKDIGKALETEIGGEKVDMVPFIEVREVEEKVAGEHIVPHVVEPSYGVGRILWCVLEHALKQEDDRTYLALAPHIAPISCGVFPLVNRDGLPELAKAIEEALRDAGIDVIYDDGGSIGRRYARCDEIGVPFGVTVDAQTLDDGTVTLRERDSRKQERVPVDDLPLVLGVLLAGEGDVEAGCGTCGPCVACEE